MSSIIFTTLEKFDGEHRHNKDDVHIVASYYSNYATLAVKVGDRLHSKWGTIVPEQVEKIREFIVAIKERGYTNVIELEGD